MRRRLFGKLMRLLFTRKIELLRKLRIVNNQFARCYSELAMLKQEYHEACADAASERSRNETLRRLLLRQHEVASVSLPGYHGSPLETETKSALKLTDETKP